MPNTCGFKFKCQECGSYSFKALTHSYEDPNVDAIECTECEHVRRFDR